MEGKVIKRKLRYDLMYVKGYCATGIGGGGGEGSMNGQLRRVEDDLNITYTYDAMMVFKFSCNLSIIPGIQKKLTNCLAFNGSVILR